MNAKQRDSLFQHWRSVIVREMRDLESLQRVGDRALNDPDVRSEPEVEVRMRAEIAELRAGFQIAQAETRPHAPASVSAYTPPTPATVPVRDQVRALFTRFSENLQTFLAQRDEAGAALTFERMRALQQETPEVISPESLIPFEQSLRELRIYLERMRERIAALTQSAITASRRGEEQKVAELMQNLRAFHAAHPALLTDARVEQIRGQIVNASEHHEHRVAAQKLVDRERAIAAEIKRLAQAVHSFHQVARAVPHTSNEFRVAEGQYQKAIKEVRAHDREWFIAFILGLADLLAEWNHPPRSTEEQVDRFIESIRAGLDQVREEMREIDAEQRGPE